LEILSKHFREGKRTGCLLGHVNVIPATVFVLYSRFPVLLIVHTLKKKHFDNNIPLRGREKLIVHPNVLKYDRWRFLSPTAFLPDVLLVYILRPREK